MFYRRLKGVPAYRNDKLVRLFIFHSLISRPAPTDNVPVHHQQALVGSLNT
jgi:hypothetical protein